MELYIRGAWRTFSTQPPRKRPKNSDVEHSPSSDANELLSLRASSARLLGSEPESQAADNVLAKSVPSRQSQCVQTRNVGDLKAFFEALMGRRVAFDEEGQYKLSINGSRCLVIAGALDAGDAKGLHVSKPDTKVRLSGGRAVRSRVEGVLTLPDCPCGFPRHLKLATFLPPSPRSRASTFSDPSEWQEVQSAILRSGK